MNELTLTPTQIKAITPYLDNLVYQIHNPKKKEYIAKPITNNMRAFAWYYVFNNNNGSDAHRRAYGKKRKNLTKQDRQNDSSCAYEKLNKPYIQEAIKRIQQVLADQVRDTLHYQLINRLKTIAFFDPFEIINEDGELLPKYKSIEEVPKHLRICIKPPIKFIRGRRIVEFESREAALKELVKIAPDLLQPQKTEISFDLESFNTATLSDAELHKLLAELQLALTQTTDNI